MPTTLAGAVLFVVLIAPGLVFAGRRRAVSPVTKPSALRETSVIVLTSVVFDAAALTIFGVVRILLPNRATPDVGALVRSARAAYLQAHYTRVAVWALATILLACLLAGAAAASRLDGLRNVLDPGAATAEPAWWKLFKAHSDARVLVEAQLDDGTYVTGLLYSFSPESDETPDRELTLARTASTKIRMRAPGEAAMRDVDDVDALVLSARRILWLGVTYVPA